MPKSEVKDIRIARAIRLIKSKFAEDVDFNQLARFLDLCPSRLRHLFKEQTGMSFKKYLRQVRMKEAQHLLKTTFLRVNKIAERVGIRDSSHFVRDFEKEFGLSPDKYRKRHLSNKENQLPKPEEKIFFPK